MALYPPIIDSFKAIQLKGDNNNIIVHYTSNNNIQIAETFEVSAIDPRSGANVRKTTGDIQEQKDASNKLVKGQITVPLVSTAKIAQVALRAKSSTETSIPSQAVIFKLMNEAITVTSTATTKSITNSPYRFTANVTFSGTDPDELAWYQIELKTGATSLIKTDKLYPKTKNTIDEIIDYDFWFRNSQTYQFNITIGTKNGIIKSFSNVDGNWSVNSAIVQLPTSPIGSASLQFNNSTIKATWIPPQKSNFSAGTYSAILYAYRDKTWAQIGTTSSVTVPDKTTKTELVFNLATTKTRATKYRIVFKKGSSVDLCTNEFWHAAYGADILLKESASRYYYIKYNPEIGSMKQNQTDVITPTLGAKFPFIYRNGHQSYRTFTIGGLIARPNDNDDVTYYGADEDIIQERFYREDLLDFLYNDKVKLFSSMQEGEMLIKLTGVSVTPMKQLGRMLYSFTATATEIDECTEANLEKYGIEE